MEFDVYEINRKDYLLLKQIDNYLYLSNKDDEQDIMIRKINRDMLYPLDNEDELKYALSMFIKK